MSNKNFFDDYFKAGKNPLPFNWDLQKVTNTLRDSVRNDYQIRKDVNGTGVIEIECEVPGVAKENITVELNDKYLYVVANGNERGDKEFKFYVDNVIADEISARCENGLLTITIVPVTRTKSKNSINVE